VLRYFPLTLLSFCVSFKAPLVSVIVHQDALLLTTVTVGCTRVLVPALSVTRNITVQAPGLALMVLLMSLRFR
jgi:hypothetical protein